MAKQRSTKKAEKDTDGGLSTRMVYGAGALFVFGVGIALGSLLTGPQSPRTEVPRTEIAAAEAPADRSDDPSSASGTAAGIPLSQAFRSPLTSQERNTATEPTDIPKIVVAEPAIASPPPETVAPAPLPVPPARAAREGKPMIAIVIDDMGVAKARSAKAAALPGPLTLSYLPYAEDLPAQTATALGNGHELLVHMPMEPLNADIDPGPYALLSGVDEITLLDILTWNLARFDGYVGVNNHMGSRFTADGDGMDRVMRELKRRGLFFLDSVTSPKTVALDAARRAGVPASHRDVFLDHVDDAAEIRRALEKTLAVAEEQGTAVAIGHPRANTIEVLNAWLGGEERARYRLVPLSEIMRVRMSGDPRLAALKP
ncbi:MAG: divergent polysaccharide deacetylase family protein [Alphaproteobacteria bacterium]|nr:divergent polysaccharide deacetylase family protein [Alphaproteobacteria bacterium]